MKKLMSFALVALLLFSVSSLVSAARYADDWYCSYYEQNYNDLTEEQKANVDAWHQERLDYAKERLQDRVKRGWITQEEADRRFATMEERIKDDFYGCGPMSRGHYSHRRSCCW